MNISDTILRQRKFFDSGVTKKLEIRLKSLLRLSAAVEENEALIIEALKEDLNKSKEEAYITEINELKRELRYIIKNLPKWAKEQKVKTAISQFPARCFTVGEPYSVTLTAYP